MTADISPTTVNGRSFYRVRIGPINSVADYDQIAARMTALGLPDSRLAMD